MDPQYSKSLYLNTQLCNHYVQLQKLFPNRFYNYNVANIKNVLDTRNDVLLCSCCYNTISIQEDTCRIVSQKKNKTLSRLTNGKKTHVFIKFKCHLCGKITTKTMKKYQSIIPKHKTNIKKQRQTLKTTTTPPIEKRKSTQKESGKFQNSLVEKMKNKQKKEETQRTSEARSSLLSFLKSVN
ncbi:Uncharacterized protein QTN25_001568 [Entamoeba marina]